VKAAFANGRVTELRLLDGPVVVRDPAPKGEVSLHINDPRFGGLGCFGVHIARRNEFFPDGLVNFTWDLTERMNAAERGGYGVCGRDGNTVLLSDGESYPAPILAVTRDVEVLHDGVRMTVTVEVKWNGSGNQLFFKEPKIVAHGLRGYQFIQCRGSDGQPLGPRRDLAKLAKPSVHTIQFRQLRRADVRLTGSRPPVTLTFDKSGWDAWADAADAAEPLGGGAPYCLQGPPAGHLSRAWESAHWPGVDAAGVMFHAWEGGTGYMDCLCAFRPAVPGARQTVALTATWAG
jgi:hypothetical protein